MEYPCQFVPIDKLLLNAEGRIEPLCDTCVAPDCTNPIKEYAVYIQGIQKKCRLWVTGNAVRQVVRCDGYVCSDQIKKP